MPRPSRSGERCSTVPAAGRSGGGHSRGDARGPGARGRVSALWLTAGLFHQVVDADVAAIAGVRQLFAGGDVLSAAHVRRTLAALGEGRLINGYGPTEARRSVLLCTIAERVGGRSCPSGGRSPTPEYTCLTAGSPAGAAGVCGELYIAGEGLRGAISSAGADARSGLLRPDRWVRGAACTEAGTWRAGSTTGRWSSSGERISR